MKIKQLALFFLLIAATHSFGQQLKFNEFSFSNTGAVPSDNLAAGQYNGSPDWVEIYNNTFSPLTYTITGWYLSDDRYNLRKWQFPFVNNLPLKLDTHNVVVVYLCGHDKAVTNAAGTNSLTIGVDLHANFTIDQTKPGTKLYLTKVNSYTCVDSIDVFKYKTKPGHSWGRAQRKPNATNSVTHWITPGNWRLYSTMTPGKVNPDTTLIAPTAWYYDYCPIPKIDLPPGFYAGGLPTINVTDTLEGITTSLWYNINRITNTVTGTQPYSGIEIYATNDCTPPAVLPQNLIASAGTTGTPLTGTFATPNAAIAPVSMVRVMMHDANIPKRWLDGFEFYGAYIDDSLKYKMSLTCVCVDTAKLFQQALPKDSTPMIINHFNKAYKEVFRNQGQGHVGKIDFYNPIGSPAMKKKQWQFVFRSEDEYGYHYTNTSQFFTNQTLGLSNRSDFPEIMFRSAAQENFLYPGGTAPTSGFQGAHIRDFYNHTISLRHDLRFDASHYVPTYMVINGWPKGIYYVKETIDSLYTNYYYNRPHAAILANSPFGTPVTVSGLRTPTASTLWNSFYNYAMMPSTNVHQPPIYYRLSDSLDFNSLNDYMVYNFLSVNADFVKRYAIWWKGLPNDTADHRTTQAKWRFGLTSTDYTWGFDLVNGSGIANTTPTSDPCDFMTAAGINYTLTANPPSSAADPIIPLWFKLMRNDTFKSEFITRYSDLLNSALSCDSLEDHLKYVRTLFAASDMASHIWWNLSNVTSCGTCDSVKYWNGVLDSMKIFIAQRCTLVSTALTNCFPEITGPYNLCIDVSPVNSGYVQFNSLQLKSFIWNGKYFDSIINVIKGIPYQNYMFDHWETSYNVSPNKTSDSATFYVPTDGCIKAIFKLRPAYETYGTPMVPTGFSPNNDGNNDILNIYGIADASSYELEVYSRWGEQIFHSVNKTEGWDGKFNGTDAPAGVYAYRYNIILNGKTYKATGNVTLVR